MFASDLEGPNNTETMNAKQKINDPTQRKEGRGCFPKKAFRILMESLREMDSSEIP